MMFPLQRCCLLLFALFVAARAEAQLAVEVTRGSTQAIPVAVVPFADTALAGGTDPAAVVAADLDRSGRFRTLPRAELLEQPSTAAQVDACAFLHCNDALLRHRGEPPVQRRQIAVDGKRGLQQPCGFRQMFRTATMHNDARRRKCGGHVSDATTVVQVNMGQHDLAKVVRSDAKFAKRTDHHVRGGL